MMKIILKIVQPPIDQEHKPQDLPNLEASRLYLKALVPWLELHCKIQIHGHSLN